MLLKPDKSRSLSYAERSRPFYSISSVLLDGSGLGDFGLRRSSRGTFAITTVDDGESIVKILLKSLLCVLSFT